MRKNLFSREHFSDKNISHGIEESESGREEEEEEEEEKEEEEEEQQLEEEGNI
jgi:hypothetical protein